MFSSAEKAEAIPTVPPTLNAEDEMSEYYANRHNFTPNTLPQYTPYLGLRARLSQVWINKWTVLLLLVLFRVLLAIQNLDQNIASARTEALSACTKVEDIGSAVASMPHYLSAGVNELAADGVTKAVNGLMDMLTLSVTSLENIVLFVINMLTSTYVCLITLVIGGSLHVAIEMIEKVGDFMNQTIDTITGDITNDVTSFQTSFNKFLSGLSSVSGLFGGSSSPPQLDLTSQLASLKSIQIDPTTLDSDLNTLNNNIPTFAQVQNFTNSVISTPFEIIKQQINSSIATYTFDRSVFPVAQKQALTFCSDNSSINDFFNGLVDIEHLAKRIFIIIVSILAVIACVPMAYREIWRWRTMQQRALLLQKHAFDPMDVMYIASRPYTSTAGIKAASRFKSPKRQILTRWTIAYATSIPALFVLALGIAGLFSCLCQYILLRTVEKEVPLLASEAGDFAGTVVNALNNVSEKWAVSANGVIESTNNKINEDVFGWIQNGSTAINNTLNTFMTEINTAINQTFSGTILLDPVQQTLNCLLGLKVDAVEKGLTWLNENAKFTFPEFRNDTFSLGAAASLTNDTADESFLASPGSVATDDITNAIQKVVDIMIKTLRSEAIVSATLITIWLLIVLIGFIRAIVGMVVRDKTRAEGGTGLTGDHRNPLSPRSPDLNDGHFEGAFGEKKLPQAGSEIVDGTSSKFGMFGTNTSEVHHSDAREAWAAGAVVGTSENMGKVGSAGRKGVVERRGHERESSYGYISGTGGKF